MKTLKAVPAALDVTARIEAEEQNLLILEAYERFFDAIWNRQQPASASVQTRPSHRVNRKPIASRTNTLTSTLVPALVP